jgi:hypothetical protein
MKKIIFALFTLATLSLTNCGSSKTAVDPVIGTWNIVVKETPQGDVPSNLVISKDEASQYVGNLNSAMGNILLQDLSIEEQKLKAKFQIQGMDFSLSGTFDNNTFNGVVTGMGGFFEADGTKMVTP